EARDRRERDEQCEDGQKCADDCEHAPVEQGDVAPLRLAQKGSVTQIIGEPDAQEEPEGGCEDHEHACLTCKLPCKATKGRADGHADAELPPTPWCAREQEEAHVRRCD